MNQTSNSGTLTGDGEGVQGCTGPNSWARGAFVASAFFAIPLVAELPWRLHWHARLSAPVELANNEVFSIEGMYRGIAHLGDAINEYGFSTVPSDLLTILLVFLTLRILEGGDRRQTLHAMAGPGLSRSLLKWIGACCLAPVVVILSLVSFDELGPVRLYELGSLDNIFGAFSPGSGHWFPRGVSELVGQVAFISLTFSLLWQQLRRRCGFSHLTIACLLGAVSLASGLLGMDWSATGGVQDWAPLILTAVSMIGIPVLWLAGFVLELWGWRAWTFALVGVSGSLAITFLGGQMVTTPDYVIAANLAGAAAPIAFLVLTFRVRKRIAN